MANLTVTVDEQVLRRARIRALEQGTSVNALVTDYLTRFAGMGATERALAEFLEIAERSHASSGPEGRTWRREDLYDRPVLRDRA
jgi:hypothetical protein